MKLWQLMQAHATALRNGQVDRAHRWHRAVLRRIARIGGAR